MRRSVCLDSFIVLTHCHFHSYSNYYRGPEVNAPAPATVAPGAWTVPQPASKACFNGTCTVTVYVDDVVKTIGTVVCAVVVMCSALRVFSPTSRLLLGQVAKITCRLQSSAACTLNWSCSPLAYISAFVFLSPLHLGSPTTSPAMHLWVFAAICVQSGAQCLLYLNVTITLFPTAQPTSITAYLRCREQAHRAVLHQGCLGPL